MTNFSRSLLLIIGLLISRVALASQAASLDAALDSTIIVHAKVIRIDGNERSNTSTQQVDRVYFGRIENGAEFIDSSSCVSTIGFGVCPLLEFGQDGIWLLRATDAGYGRRGLTALGSKWPVRKGVDANFEQIKMMAESLEKVWLAAPSERMEMLKGLASNEIPEVSVAAVQLLWESAPDELRDLTPKLMHSSMPLPTAVSLDEAMCDIDPTKWPVSDARRVMLRQWSTAMSNADHASLILNRLETAIQRRQMAPQELFEFVIPVITGEFPEQTRSRAIGALRWIANDRQLHDQVFDVLSKMIEDAHDVRAALIAAQTLKQMDALNSRQLAMVSAMHDAWQERAAATTARRDPAKTIEGVLAEIKRRGKTKS
jgi:hypothetical protein